jgi:outer membrane protein assembly factor BamB
MLSALVFLWLAATAGAATPDWPAWGGPYGNFVVDGKGLPANFAENAPKRLWQRNLGDDGYSCIVTDDSQLYTMYRRGNQEVVIAMSPADGSTKWEYAYDATYLPKMGMEHGGGPHATPLIMGNYVYTIGVLARMHALDKRTGKVVWSKDLWKDFPGSTFMGRGYPVSPIAFKNTIIVKLGEHGHAIVALNPKDGSVIW